jgi:hypothetical protein
LFTTKVAVETLCRALAGKNRQLHGQLEEYGKLVLKYKHAERGLRAAQAKLGEDGGVETHDGPLDFETVSETRGVKRGASSGLGVGDERVPGTSRASRGWGREEGFGDAAGTLGTAFPSAKNGDFFGKPKNSQRPAAATLVGGPLSRVPALSTARKMNHEKSGEDLLDDILGGIDANADLKVSKKKKSLQKQNPGSFVGRNGGDADLQNHGTVGDGSGRGGSFIIHGPDGRGGRTKIVRPGKKNENGHDAQSNGALDQFLTRR